jgi:hypothetical protein
MFHWLDYQFVKLIAGPDKLQPKCHETEKLRAISILPYFADGHTMKFVKFPDFSTDGMDPTDIELLMDFALFKKTPEPLLIQTELDVNKDPMGTTARLQLFEDIDGFIQSKWDEDSQIWEHIAEAKRLNDKDKVKDMLTKWIAMEVILECLKTEQVKLETPVDFEQAGINHAVLDGAVKEWHDIGQIWQVVAWEQ